MKHHQEQKIPTIPFKEFAKHEGEFNIKGTCVLLPELPQKEVASIPTVKCQNAELGKPRKIKDTMIDLILESDQVKKKDLEKNKENRTRRKSVGPNFHSKLYKDSNAIELPSLGKIVSARGNGKSNFFVVAESCTDTTRLDTASKPGIKTDNSLSLTVHSNEYCNLKTGSSLEFVKVRKSRKSIKSNNFSIEEKVETSNKENTKPNLDRNPSRESTAESAVDTKTSELNTGHLGVIFQDAVEDEHDTPVPRDSTTNRHSRRPTTDAAKVNNKDLENVAVDDFVMQTKLRFPPEAGEPTPQTNRKSLKMGVPNQRDLVTAKNSDNQRDLVAARYSDNPRDSVSKRNAVPSSVIQTATLPNSRNSKKTIKEEIHNALLKHSKLVSKFRKPGKSPATFKSPKKAHLQDSTFLNWLRVHNCIKLVRCVRNVYKAISKRNHAKISSMPVRDNGSLSYILKLNLIEPDTAFVGQVEELLKQPKCKRSESSVANLEMLLRLRMPGFSKFPLAERLFLCQAITIEHYDKDTIILSEGQAPTCFYFVLSGQVELVRINDGYKYRIDVLNSGSIFGEQCLSINSVKRIFTAATTAKSKLLYISKAEYIEYITKKEDQEAQRQISDTLGMYALKSFKPFLKTLISNNFFHIYSFTKGQVILEEGRQFNELYWVLDGVCKVTRKLPFLRYQGILASTSFGEMQHENYTQILVETQDLNVGDFFPNIPTVKEGTFSHQDIQKNVYVDFFERLYPDDSKTFQKTGVIADGMVTLAAIKLTDLMPVVPCELLYKLIQEPCIELYDLVILQRKVLSQQEWKSTKTKILHNI
ncbi:hypothetical protein HDV01_003259 [Terramyces sp. JEL0728]|nr:hypothetical protein HDV01_003259 [Terramyces sp. JEL0728]